MKKVSCIILVIILIFALVSCNNLSPEFKLSGYNKVHICSIDTCFEIINWNYNEVGMRVVLKDYGTLILSNGTYILINDKCPICD